MALKDAVEAIAEEMVREADDLSSGVTGTARSYLRDSLLGYARTLRIAVKASEGTTVSSAPISLFASPQLQHHQEIEKAKAEFRKHKNRGEAEESESEEMVLVIGGSVAPDDAPVYQAIDPKMPLDARMMLAGGVYQLRKDEQGRKRLCFERLSQIDAV